MLVARVKLKDQKATVFTIIDNQEIPIREKKYEDVQVYDTPKYSDEDTKNYKDILYSKEGLKLVNRLKNQHLIKRDECKRVLKSLDLPDKLINKLVRYLYPNTIIRQLDFRVEEESFCRLSFKDLGITKEKVINLFIEKMHVDYEGIEFDEDLYYEYDNIQELQSVVDYTLSILTKEGK